MKDLNIYTININLTIKHALEIMNYNGKGIVFVKNNRNTIIASITDGDIRRALLKGKGLHDSIDTLMNRNFKFISEYESIKKALLLMEQYKIRCIPIINTNGHLIDVLDYNELKSSYNNTPILIFAGGKGERLMPLTLNTPKPLIKIGNKTLIEINIDKLLNDGFNNIFISLNYKSNLIMNSLLSIYNNILKEDNFFIETKALGTAGSLYFLKDCGYENIITYNADILTDLNLRMMSHFHDDNKADITCGGVYFTYNSPFGEISYENNTINKINEKPKKHNIISSGINIINKNIFSNIEYKYLSMTDLINNSINNKKNVQLYKHSGFWIDIGEWQSYKKAEMIYGRY